MSEDIDRKQVLQNIKVRKALKKDASWIQKPKDAKVDCEVKQKPAPGRKSLYVLSTAKRYESSANQTNNKINPVKNDALPEKARENTTRDTKLQSPSEQINKHKTQEQLPVKSTDVENKEVKVEAPASKPNVEQNMVPVKVSADVDRKDQIQPVVSANQNTEAENTTTDKILQSPSEHINKTQEQLPEKSTDVENKEVKVEAPAGKANVKQNMVPVKVSADVDRKDQIQPVVSANQNTEADNTTRDTKLQSPSEHINKTQEQLPVKSTDIENKEVKVEAPASKPNVEQNMVPVKVSADVDRKDQIQPVVSANQNTEADNTTRDTKLQSPSEHINKTQEQLPVKSKDVENKEVKVEAPAGKANVKQNMVPVKVSADVDRKDQIQPVVSANQNTEADNTTRDTKLQSPSEHINKTQEQLPVKSKDVENKEVKVEAPAGKANVKQNMVPVKVSADVDRKDQIQPVVSANQNTEADNTTRDTKLQSPSEHINKTQEQLPEKSTDVENKEVKVEAPAGKANVKQNMVPVKVFADVDRKDQIQPVVSANQNTEADNTTTDKILQSPSEHINKTQEQLPVKSTDIENKKVKVEAPASKPNVEQNMVPVKVSADVDRKDQIQPVVSANQNTEADNTTRDTKLQSPSEHINKTQEQLPEKSTDVENKEVKVEAPAGKANVKQNMVPVKVSADVDRKDQIQPVVSANQNTEADNTTRDTKLQSPSEHINKTQEQLPEKSTDVENKEVKVEAPAGKANVKQNMVPVKVFADVDRKDQIQPVVSANQNTEADNTTTDKILQSPSEHINKTQEQLPEKSTDVENKEVKVEAPASKPNVEQNMVPVKVSADVDRKDQIQPVVSANQNTEADNTTRDTKLQSPSEHINKTQEQLPEKSTDVENKEVKVEAPAGKANVKQNMVPVKVFADVDRKDQIQPVVSANQNTEADNTTTDKILQSPSEHINKTQEQLPEKSTDVENKEVKVEAPASKPNVEQNMVPVKVSADVDRKDQIQPVVSANQNTEADNTTRDTKLQSPSEHIKKTQEQLPVKSKDVENKEVKVEAPASKPNVEQNMVPVKVSADVDRKDQIQPVVSANQNTEAAEPPPANKAADVKGKKSDTNPTNVDYQVSSDLQVKVSVTDTAEVPATPAVVLKPQEEALFTTQPANTSSLEDAGVKVSVQTTDGSSEKALLKETQEEIVPNPLQFMVEELPENTSSPDEDVSFQTSVDSLIHLESVSKSSTQPGNETPAEDCYEKHPLEQDDKKTVKAEAEVETPDVDIATPSEEAPRVNSLQPVTYTLPEPHAAEDVVIAVKYEVDSEEDTEEPVLKKNTEEIVVAEVQSANNAAVEQNVKPSLEDVVDPMDLNIEDALKPILAADSEDVPNGSGYRAIELTDGPDVKTAQKESVPKTEESQKCSQQKPDQQPIDTKVSEELQKPAEELKSSQVPKIYWGGRPACSYCNKIIDGNIKLILSEPSVVCHPECLKKNPKAIKYIEARGLNVTKCGKDQECGVCARILGDLLTRIYLHKNVIECDVCFARALNI